MSKYKIIITLILFCFFQTTPSISLELKLPKKLGDLKKITEDIKKELEKKEPEVKKEEVKKEEVKKEEVKKEEVKKEEVKKEAVKKEIVQLDAIYFFSKCKNSKEGKFVNESGGSFTGWKDVNFYIDLRKKNIVSFFYQNVDYELGQSKMLVKYQISNDPMKDIPQFKDEIKYLKISEEEYYNGGTHYTQNWGDRNKSFKFNIYSGIITIDSPNDQWKKAVYMEKQYGNVNRKKPSTSDPYVECNVSEVSEIILFDDKKESKKETCDKLIASLAGGKKSKILGGYQDFYFGMPQNEVKFFIDCQKDLNKEIIYFDFTQERGKAKGYFTQDLYKYHTGVRLKDGKVNSIDVQLFVNLMEKTSYSGKASEEFEQIKKVVLDKYELIAKPTKVSIDEFNREDYGRLEWVLKSNIEGNLILLVYEQSPSKTKYFYTGRMDYLSSEESKIYKKESDSKVVKSDDF